MKILLTGGTGYIGSHTAVVLINAGHEVVLFDNFSNSDPSVLDRLATIVGKSIPCIEGDIRETPLVEKVLRKYEVEAVIHFVGLKAVGESSEKPLDYCDNNIGGTISLLSAMKACKVKRLIFSSSATVYGTPQYLPIDELHPTNPTNPYGRNKLYIEEMLRDLSASDVEWRICCLRYFNLVGAHESGLIREDPNGVPNNLMPYIAQVAAGKLPYLKIFGNDYDTNDGTGVRDYIHVMDLAKGHVLALEYLSSQVGFETINLGTGQGNSVLEVVKNYEAANNLKIPCQFSARRKGDVAISYASISLAKKKLKWTVNYDLLLMCKARD